jgi:hypothetical protein
MMCTRTPPSFLDFPWRWQMTAGTLKLVIDNREGFVLLRASPGSAFLTRNDDGGFRLLEATDDLAKVIAAAPDVRRHAQALINGISIGLVRIDTDADETLANVLGRLREALAKSGAA